ncbi:hypothetical protein ALQ08_104486 [Pseudomonas syringae pv. delphinii]|uniref:Uncharacterized protein n=4 Tax=Pseudomonas syringae group TaxID=136849 RepID=A0A3M4BX24_9PSED|nr:hypothetical protein ALQ36_103725 [Pseudomonas syringae pv. primulae]RMP13901.1 hypothetical protein ALQ28_104276 [Pseudomonas syringae pv. delphinii]RMQ28025.1 hypothetical protein ALQ07_103051 [Pseudomonas syringae pv. actinidiae]RMT63317.1 hypothetical protein ALP44_103012 [Pseudomonas syringae pv. theae]RMP23617.1 hypothetical protein ALQ27_104562 [Pseudomonas syringae pv. delphinii]
MTPEKPDAPFMTESELAHQADLCVPCTHRAKPLRYVGWLCT